MYKLFKFWSKLSLISRCFGGAEKFIEKVTIREGHSVRVYSVRVMRAAARCWCGRSAGGRPARGGSSTLLHSLHLHRRVWRADGRVSFSPRRVSGVRGRTRGREVHRWLAAARVRGAGASPRAAATPHAPACAASPSMRLPLLPLLVLPLVLARPAAGEQYLSLIFLQILHTLPVLHKFFSGKSLVNFTYATTAVEKLLTRKSFQIWLVYEKKKIKSWKILPY